MNPGLQCVQEQATKAAAHRLRQAATFTGLHIKQPLFQKRMGKGADSVLVRFEWPGVVSVHDPATGALLAISECGRPDVLRNGFVPPLPVQIDNANARSSQNG